MTTTPPPRCRYLITNSGGGHTYIQVELAAPEAGLITSIINQLNAAAPDYPITGPCPQLAITEGRP